MKKISNFKSLTKDEIRNVKGGDLLESIEEKAQQLFNILSTVLKTMKEMESSVPRNMN